MAKCKGVPADNTVDPVIVAARAVFCEMGYRASIDKVAVRAGVARQTIYNRFGNKQALFEMAIDHFCEEMLAPLAVNEGCIRERLLRFAVAFRAQVLSPESINTHRVLVCEAPRFPELARRHFELCIDRTARQLAVQLEAAMQAGVLRQADSFEAATFLFDLLTGYDHLKSVIAGVRPDPSGETAKVIRIVDTFLRAFQP